MSSMFQVFCQFCISKNKWDNLNKLDLNIFKYWFDNGNKPKELPKHEFFEWDMWESFVQYGSYYTYPDLIVKCNYDDVNELYNHFVMFAVKDRNSDNTRKVINLFFDYLKTVVDRRIFMGGYRREDEEQMNLVFYEN